MEWKKKAMISVLSLSLLSVNSSDAATYFTDVSTHWGKATIEWASQVGITKGYPDGKFKPENPVTEAEFLTMFVRAYKEKQGLKNLESKPWPAGYYEFAQLMKYPVSEFTEGKNALINRQRVANLIAASTGTTYSGRDAIHYLLLQGISQGKVASKITINNYDGQGLLTRAEAVRFVQNVLEKVDTIRPAPNVPSSPLPQVGDNQEIVKPKDFPDDVLTTDLNYELHDKVVSTLKIQDGRLTGKLLPLPENHVYGIIYNGLDKNGKPFQVIISDKYKIGETFTVETGTRGYLLISLDDVRIGAGYGVTRIEVPSMEMKRS
jgi:hypothetical protein